MPIWSCPPCPQQPFSEVTSASDGGIWHCHLKISICGAAIVHLKFSTSVFHKRHFNKRLSLFLEVFYILFFGHHFCLFFWERFHFFISCQNLHDVLTKKEKMTSKKSKHLANYEMNGSWLPKNQASCNFLTAYNFLIEATWLLGANEAIGNSEKDECCHVFKAVLWKKIT